MAIKGTLSVYGISIPNAYLRLGGISGGVQSGYWESDIQAFSDGGTAEQAYKAALAAYQDMPMENQTAPPSTDAVDAVRVRVSLPLVRVTCDPSASSYVALYAALMAAYPSFTPC